MLPCSCVALIPGFISTESNFFTFTSLGMHPLYCFANGYLSKSEYFGDGTFIETTYSPLWNSGLYGISTNVCIWIFASFVLASYRFFKGITQIGPLLVFPNFQSAYRIIWLKVCAYQSEFHIIPLIYTVYTILLHSGMGVATLPNIP